MLERKAMKEHGFGVGVRGKQERRQNSPLLFLLLFFSTIKSTCGRKIFETLIIIENSNIIAMATHPFSFGACILSYR